MMQCGFLCYWKTSSSLTDIAYLKSIVLKEHTSINELQYGENEIQSAYVTRFLQMRLLENFIIDIVNALCIRYVKPAVPRVHISIKLKFISTYIGNALLGMYILASMDPIGMLTRSTIANAKTSVDKSSIRKQSHSVAEKL